MIRDLRCNAVGVFSESKDLRQHNDSLISDVEAICAILREMCEQSKRKVK